LAQQLIDRLTARLRAPDLAGQPVARRLRFLRFGF